MSYRLFDKRADVMRRALFSTLCLLMAVTLAPRCGLKASPVPYPLAKPVAINDLTALARGNGVMLSWTIPDKNTDGTALKDIKGFNLVRSAIPIKDIDTGKKEVYKQWRYDYRPGERYTTVKDMDLNYRVRYSYLVFTVTKNDIVSDSSNTAVVSWDKPFLKPSGIRAKSGDHFVELSWLSPTAYIDGSRINKTVYYNVYRSPKMGDFPLFPINPALISGTTYIDGDLKNDVPYFYEVTSVSKVHDTPIESVPSSQIIAVPADLVSPARPYGVSAAPLNGGIALSWEPNTESNVMGYYVYRESGNGKGFVRVNARPISGTTYVDTGARTGYTTYHITAVDDSRQHNESAPSENYTILYRRGR